MSNFIVADYIWPRLAVNMNLSPVAIRETEKLEGSFEATDRVAGLRGSLETWSRLAFETLTERPSG